MPAKKQLTKNDLFDMLKLGGINQADYESQIREKYDTKEADIIIESTKKKLEELKDAVEAKEEESIKTTSKRFYEDTKNKTVYESIFDENGWGQFISYSYSEEIGNKPRWNYTNKFPVGNTTIIPDNSAFNPIGKYSFNHAHVYDNIPQLSYYFQETKELLKKFIYLTDKQFDLITTNILLSYQQHKVNSLGYVGILSLPESGKTILGHLISRMAYRTFFSTSKLNASNLYNFIGTDNEGDCTLVIDEFQEFSDEKNPDNREVMSILRSGYQKGAVVPRILDASSSSRIQVFYKTYNLKFLMGNYMPYDEALKSRTIETYIVGMPKDWEGEDEINAEHEKLFNDLRVKLLLSRMAHYYEPFNDIDTQAYPIRGRVREIWGPLIKTVMNTCYESNVKSIFNEWNEKYMLEKKAKLENKVAVVVSALRKDWCDIPFDSIWKGLCWLLHEPDKSELESFDSEVLDRKVTKKGVGSILRSFGGIPKVSFQRYYNFNKEIMEIVRDKYLVTSEDVDNFYLELKASDIKELLKPASQRENEATLSQLMSQAQSPAT